MKLPWKTVVCGTRQNLINYRLGNTISPWGKVPCSVKEQKKKALQFRWNQVLARYITATRYITVVAIPPTVIGGHSFSILDPKKWLNWKGSKVLTTLVKESLEFKGDQSSWRATSKILPLILKRYKFFCSRVGYTLLERKTIKHRWTGSTHTKLPVNPLCPKLYKQN